jgi:hypothetical protein
MDASEDLVLDLVLSLASYQAYFPEKYPAAGFL